MTFNTALTSPQLTQLRRTRWQGDQYISFCDNVIAFHATVASNVNLVTGTTAAAIPYTGVLSGSTANIDEGMVVIISPSSDPRSTSAIRLHVRYLVADGTYIYVSEFSYPVNIGAHIWVYYAYDVIDNLSRPVGTNPVVQYQQYDQGFLHLAPVVRGLQTGYASWVDGAGHYDIAFDVSSSFCAEFGGAMSTYQFSVVPTGSGTASVIAGSAATSTVTYRFTYGEYWLKLVVTDSFGTSWYRHSLIKAHDRASYMPTTQFDGAQITREVGQGQSAQITGYSGVSTLLNGSMCIIWVDETYSDPDLSNSAGSLFNNIDLVGWVESEKNMFHSDPVNGPLPNVSFEVQGLATRLMRLEGQMIAMTNVTVPTKWDEIDSLTPWRAVVHFLQRHTTALNLGDFSADDLGVTFQFPTIVTLAGRAFDNITGSQGIADQINANVEFASDGRMYMTRREPFVATDLSHTPVIIATWGGGDFVESFDWSFNHYEQYGFLDADGAAWSAAVNVPVMPVKNRAPGLAQGSGPDQAKLNNQILASTTSIAAAQGELAQRAGTQFALSNQVITLNVQHPAQFHWLTPSQGQVYRWDLDTTYNVRGWTINSGTNWMLKSLTIKHDNQSGSRDVSAVYVAVVTGSAGTNIPIVNPSSIPPVLPILPPMPAFPAIEPLLFPEPGLLPTQITPTGTTIDLKGNSLFPATASKAYWVTDFIKLTTPHYTDITPTDLGSFQIRSVGVSPFFTSSAIPGFLLASDGTNSAVWYSPDLAAGSATWTKGGLALGDFKILRALYASGAVDIYRPGGGGGSPVTFDFTAGDQSFSPCLTVSPSGLATAVYTAGVGWTRAYNVASSGNSETRIFRLLTGDISSISITITTDVSTTLDISDGNATSIVTTFYSVATGTGTNTITYSTPFTLTTGLRIDLRPVSGSHTLTISTSSVTLTGAAVRYSTNNGSTWASELAAGTTPGSVGGFDAQRTGANTFVSTSAKVRRATSLGGAYSDYYSVTGGANPLCIVIPYYNWAGTSQVAATNPDIIVALDALDGSSRSLLWIEGGATAGTVHDLTPVAGIIFDNANCVTVSYNHHIMVFGKVSGVYKLYRTKNKGSTWSLVSSPTAPKYIRGRRNDGSATPSGANSGQLYLADSNMYWSSLWCNTGPWIRNMPTTPIVCFDTVY